MTHFFRDGEDFFVASHDAVSIYDKLPVGTYIVKENPQSKALYLEKVDNFEDPPKLYGDIEKLRRKILNTFHSRPNQTGALFSGEKGSGKTQLARSICTLAAQEGIPTIIVNSDWNGDTFNKLIQDIDQEVVIFFDEFEKVYNHQTQEKILTLLDGVFPTKKLFILTCNDKYRIDQHMRNRPGRIFYLIEFKGVTQEFIQEYCSENLNDKSQIPSVSRLASMFGEFTFDMLKALVEEMNRYNETAEEAITLLNTSPEADTTRKFDVTFFVNGKKIKLAEDYEKFSNSPLKDPLFLVWEDDNDKWQEASLKPENLTAIDPFTGSFTYELGDYKAVLTQEQKSLYNYRALL